MVVQVFQAYEQRLPATAVVEMTSRNAVQPGTGAHLVGGGIGGPGGGACVREHRTHAVCAGPVLVTVASSIPSLFLNPCLVSCARLRYKVRQLSTPFPLLFDSLTLCPPPFHPPAVTGAYSYDCPGEALMDVSWHITANPAPGQLNNFIMEPNLAAAVGVSGAGLIGRYAQCCVLSLEICSGAWKGAGVSVELPKVHHGSSSCWKLCDCWLCCQAVRFVLDNASFQQLKGVLHGILLSVLPPPLCKNLPGCPVCVGQCQVIAPEGNVNNQHNFCLLRTSPNHDLVLLPAVHAAAACVLFSAGRFCVGQCWVPAVKRDGFMADQARTQTCTYLKIMRPNICSRH